LQLHTPKGRFSRAERDALVEKALTDVFLWNDVKDKLKKKATLLTLEQQQKLCIARLLPLKPRVILMDEPCSALDAEGTAAIETLIEGLREKYTIVIVTHNMGQAARVSQECLYMLLGELIEHGSTQDIFLRPKRKETEMYIEGRYG
jgi:phosphate transport system ATP-binding protein